MTRIRFDYLLTFLAATALTPIVLPESATRFGARAGDDASAVQSSRSRDRRAVEQRLFSGFATNAELTGHELTASDVSPAAPLGVPAVAGQRLADERLPDHREADLQAADDGSDIPMSPEMAALHAKLRRVLDRYERDWRLNTRDHSAWEVMHAVVAYGVRSRLAVGGPQGELQNSVGALCYNMPFRSPSILQVQGALPAATRGVGVQGHHGQLLAILAQSGVSKDYPLYVGGRPFVLEDLIEQEKLTCRMGEELTFKLIALSHYLPPDATWRSNTGEEWSIPKLIREEIRAPIQKVAACGGTHRLMGVSYAVRRREQRGLPIVGEWARAEKYTQDYIEYAFNLQNSDGSFSTQWLEYREARPDRARRLQCSGHILEWLAFAASEDQLFEPRMLKAVNYLADLLEAGQPGQWEIGPLGHGLHALAIYDRRMFGTPHQTPAEIAAAQAAAQAAERPQEVERR